MFFLKPRLDRVVFHAAFPFLEKILDNTKTVFGIEAIPFIAILGPFRTIELIKHAKHLVHKRTARKNGFALNVGARTRHAANERFGRSVFVDNLFPIPGKHLFVLFAGQTLRPCETQRFVRCLGSVLLREGTDVVRNAERHQRLDLRFFGEQERVVFTLPIDDGIHLFQMELIRNRTVVTRFQASQKHLVIHGFPHSGIALVIMGGRSFE